MVLSQKSENTFNGNLRLSNKQKINIRIKDTKKNKQISNIQIKSAMISLISKVATLVTFACISKGALVASQFGFIAFFGLLHLSAWVLSIYLLNKIFKIKVEEAKNKQQPKIPIYLFFIPLFIANALFIASVFFTPPLILVIACSLMIFVSMMNLVRVVKEYVEQRNVSNEVDKKAIRMLCVDIAYSVLNICLLSLVVASSFVLPTVPIQIAILTVFMITIGFDLVNLADKCNTSKFKSNDDTNDLISFKCTNVKGVNIDELQSYDGVLDIIIDRLDDEEDIQKIDLGEFQEIPLDELEANNMGYNGEKKTLINGDKQSGEKSLLSRIIVDENLCVSSGKKQNIKK